MDENNLLLPGGALSIIAAAFLGWLFSGQIRKTDADRLWDEAGKIRQDLEQSRDEYARRAKEQDIHVKALEKALETYAAENANLRMQVLNLQEENVQLRSRVSELEVIIEQRKHS